MDSAEKPRFAEGMCGVSEGGAGREKIRVEAAGEPKRRASGLGYCAGSDTSSVAYRYRSPFLPF
jgi:hypothetical protein